MQEYIDIVDNTSLIDDLVTTKVKDNHFYDYFGNKYFIDDVNSEASIECLRKFNNSYFYSIHVTESNAYYIHFFKNVDGVLKCEFIHKYSTYINSENINIIKNETTIDELREMYPLLQTRSFSNPELQDFAYIYYSDGSVYIVEYDWIDNNNYITDYQLYLSPMSNIYYNMLLDIDKNVIFDYDED
jgi:hypothetical protein